MSFGTIIVWALDTRRVAQTRDYRAFEQITPAPDDGFDHLDLAAYAIPDPAGSVVLLDVAQSAPTTAASPTPPGVPAGHPGVRSPAPTASTTTPSGPGIAGAPPSLTGVPPASPRAHAAPTTGVHDFVLSHVAPRSPRSPPPTPAGVHAASPVVAGLDYSLDYSHDDDDDHTEPPYPAPLLGSQPAPANLTDRAVNTLAHESRQTLGMDAHGMTRAGRATRPPSRLGARAPVAPVPPAPTTSPSTQPLPTPPPATSLTALPSLRG